MKLTAYLTIHDHRIEMTDKAKFFATIRTQPDGLYRWTIERVYRKRSNPQNDYYWGVVIPAFCQGFYDTWGEPITGEEAHATLKESFNYQLKTNPKTGDMMRIARSTASLTTVEFNEYIERCCHLIAEYFGVAVPEPTKNNEYATTD
jgi:hypothetical protein